MDATRTTPLRERMRQELQLAGLSERTQEVYLCSVRQLAAHFGKQESGACPGLLNNGLQGRLRGLQSMFSLGRTGMNQSRWHPNIRN